LLASLQFCAPGPGDSAFFYVQLRNPGGFNMSEKSERRAVTYRIERDLDQVIRDVARENRRTLNETVQILLERAVSERSDILYR
jgi:hypothetical protein